MNFVEATKLMIAAWERGEESYMKQVGDNRVWMSINDKGSLRAHVSIYSGEVVALDAASIVADWIVCNRAEADALGTEEQARIDAEVRPMGGYIFPGRNERALLPGECCTREDYRSPSQTRSPTKQIGTFAVHFLDPYPAYSFWMTKELPPEIRLKLQEIAMKTHRDFKTVCKVFRGESTRPTVRALVLREFQIQGIDAPEMRRRPLPKSQRRVGVAVSTCERCSTNGWRRDIPTWHCMQCADDSSLLSTVEAYIEADDATQAAVRRILGRKVSRTFARGDRCSLPEHSLTESIRREE